MNGFNKKAQTKFKIALSNLLYETEAQLYD